MREIKFRAWDKAKNLMIYFSPVSAVWTNGSWGENIDNYQLECVSNLHPGKTCYPHDDFNCQIDLEIEQFTGLRDKNGREIYEGDICRHPTCSGRDSIHEVEYFLNESFDFIYIDAAHSSVEWESNGFYCGDYPVSEYLEIIGNIHENPELLKCS